MSGLRQLVADALVECGAVRADRLDVIRRGQVQIGMTQIEVVAAWGEPDDRNRYVFASGVQEQWVYGSPRWKQSYLYFQDGVLTSLQV
jgi:hypothetical protein